MLAKIESQYFTDNNDKSISRFRKRLKSKFTIIDIILILIAGTRNKNNDDVLTSDADQQASHNTCQQTTDTAGRSHKFWQDHKMVIFSRSPKCYYYHTNTTITEVLLSLLALLSPKCYYHY